MPMHGIQCAQVMSDIVRSFQQQEAQLALKTKDNCGATLQHEFGALTRTIANTSKGRNNQWRLAVLFFSPAAWRIVGYEGLVLHSLLTSSPDPSESEQISDKDDTDENNTLCQASFLGP